MKYTLENPITPADLNTDDEGAVAVATLVRRPRARRRTKAVRLCDVARAAGVSTATVSMVVNGNPRISATTQRRVRRVLDRMGYRQTVSAATGAFAAARKGTVLAVLLPAQRYTFADAYFGELISGICDQAASMGHTVMFERVSPEFVRDRQHLAMLEQRVAHGLLMLGFNDQHRFMDYFDADRHPVVVVDNKLTREDLDFVGCDYRSGAKQAMNYLLQLGHRNVGLITSSAGGRDDADLVDVYREAMAEYNVIPGDGWIADAPFTEEGGADAADQILRRHPEMTALFAAGDTMAVGALHTASRRGLSVPRDLSVVGFDNLRHAAFLNPALTTVQLPLHEVGAQACERLAERIGGRTETVQDRLPAHLVLRDSTAMARDLPPQADSSAA